MEVNQPEPETNYTIDTSKKVRTDKMADPLEKPDAYMNAQNIDDPSQQQHDSVFSQRVRLPYIRDFVEAVAAIPTYFPKNFWQQFKLQFFDDKNRLYIYDYVNRRWCWAQLNIDEYDITQLDVPSDLIAQWIAPNPGVDSNASKFANGVNVFSGNNTAYSWTNVLIGFGGFLDFDNQKKIRFELTGFVDSVAAGSKHAFGFIDTNGTPGLLVPLQGYNISDIERTISFRTVGTTLYAVVADGTSNTHTAVPGITLSTSVSLRLKFLWEPTNGLVKFYVNDDLKVTMDVANGDAIPITAGVDGLFNYYAGAGIGGLNATFPKFGLQIN